MSFPKYQRYKNSGLGIMGEVPSHWQVCKLRQVGRLLKGSGGSKDDIVESGIPCVRYGDIYTTHSFFVEKARTCLTKERAAAYTPLKYGDVLFAASGEKIEEIGKSVVNLILGDAVCGGDMVLLRPTVELWPRYMGYAADSAPSVLQKASMGRGTTVKHIYPDELRHLVLALPPYSEQQAIAAFLDHEAAKIDALVTEQKQLIELLKNKRQALISRAVTRGLNICSAMRDSGVPWLGQVPLHWEVRRIASLSTKITNGYVGPTRGIFTDDGVRYLQSLHIKNNRIHFDVPYFVSQEWSRQHAKSILRAGDVLVVQTGDIGQAAVVTDDFEGCNCHALIIVSPIHAVVRGEWIGWVLNSHYGFHSLSSIQTGALHPHLNCGDVRDVFIPVPPVSEQLEIIRALEQQLHDLDTLISAVLCATELLQERRTALISAAVTGQIDVRPESMRTAA